MGVLLGVFFKPLLWIVGFTAVGVRARSIAAFLQRVIFGAVVPAASWFARLLSIAMTPAKDDAISYAFVLTRIGVIWLILHKVIGKSLWQMRKAPLPCYLDIFFT